MEKKRRVTKKRGKQAQTTKTSKEEEMNCHSVDANALNSNASSSPGHKSSSLHESMVSRPFTRSALARGNKRAKLSPQSRIPAQDTDGNSSETLMLVKQILFQPNTVDKANHAPGKSKDEHSEPQSMSADNVSEPQEGVKSSSKRENHRTPQTSNMLDLKKFTSDLLAQSPKPEFPYQIGSPSSDECMVNIDLPDREANMISGICANGTAGSSENRTTSPDEVMSMSNNPKTSVEGYKISKELEPLLKAIFIKYGDIARESTFSIESRSCLLELVCSIYKRLEASSIMQLIPLELDSMASQIQDLELVKVDVGWLRKRLDQISKARKMYDDGVSKLEDLEARGAIDMVIEEKQKTVKMCEEELHACMAAALKLQQRLQQEKDELAAAHICSGSLVHGLV